MTGNTDCDVAIVGAGLTGLWTAYALAVNDPELSVVVLEAEIAGYGASGRNAGFVSAGLAGRAEVYERTHGAAAVMRAERVLIEAIDWIGGVVAREGIDCGFAKGGSFRVATSAPQVARIRATLASRRARGIGEDDAWPVSAEEIREHVSMAEILGGAYTPHCARVDPARLVRGLAEACERRGVVIYEHSPAREIGRGRVRCNAGVVRAEIVVRATESYTTRLPGERRRYLPVFSHMLATEPLPAETWEQIGWERGETVADQRHLFFYAQRTPDGRIAIGGLGAPYRFGNVIREEDEQRPAVHARLEQALRRHFPQAAQTRITHRWGGPFAAPRDWSMGVVLDRSTGLGFAGGYTGHGVVGSNVGGRTLADLILGRETALVTLPWVGHVGRRWEPEPARWLAGQVIPAVLASADRYEELDRPPCASSRPREALAAGTLGLRSGSPVMLQPAKREPGKDAESAGIGQYGRDRGRSMATRCSRLERMTTFGTEH